MFIHKRGWEWVVVRWYGHRLILLGSYTTQQEAEIGMSRMEQGPEDGLPEVPLAERGFGARDADRA